MITLNRISYNLVQYQGTPDEEVFLESCLTLSIEGAEFSEIYRKGHWDGNVRYYKDSTFPYGFIDVVVNHLAKNKIAFKCVEEYKPFISKLPFNDKLHQHQREACEAFFREQFGIIIVPTRGGKTFLAAETTRHFKHANRFEICLFIVDTEDLYNQARTEISSYLNEKVGGIRGDEFDLQPVTVATIQTLESILAGLARFAKRSEKHEYDEEVQKAKRAVLRKRKQNLQIFLKEVTYLIVDECHEFTSPKRTRVINKCENANKRLFLSATPFHSESIVANYNLTKISGRVIYTITEQVLKERGILAKDKILLIYIDHNKNKNIEVTHDSRYDVYYKQLITHNFYRNMILLSIVEICRKLMLKTLVLFTIKKHGYWLQTITGDEFLHGEHDGGIRNTVRQAFLKVKGGVLLASNIFKKGVTLPQVQVMVNAGGGLEKINVVQKKGRVLGVTEDKKKALIIDFIDNYEYFKEHSLNRIAAYEESVTNPEDIIVLDADDNEFFQDVRNVITDWFDL